MKNIWNNLYYIIANIWNIEQPDINYDYYTRISTDNFYSTNDWYLNHPEAIMPSRSNGARLKLIQLSNNKFTFPTITSKINITNGCVIIKPTLSKSKNVIHTFLLRHTNENIGFEITSNKIFVVAFNKIIPFKLFNPDDDHSFEIEINPKTNMIFWRVNNITIYELKKKSIELKSIVISLVAKGKITASEFPIAFQLKSVDILTHKELQ